MDSSPGSAIVSVVPLRLRLLLSTKGRILVKEFHRDLTGLYEGQTEECVMKVFHSLSKVVIRHLGASCYRI